MENIGQLINNKTTMSQYTNEKEFDEKLSEIGDCYEQVKDGLNSVFEDMTSEEYDNAMDALQKLRDIAAMQLKENYTLKEN